MSNKQMRAPSIGTFNLTIYNFDGTGLCSFISEEERWSTPSNLNSSKIKVSISGIEHFKSLEIDTTRENSDKLLTILTKEQYDSDITEIIIPDEYLKGTYIYFKINGVFNEVIIDIKNKIQITCSTPEASIYYTTDNTDPDETKNLYTDIIEVPNYTTVKAIGIKEGYINSEVSQKDIFY